MIGLEGSGFTISIGVTLLLVGLVVFYFKQRMDEWDNKLQGMLNLNKALAASHAALEQRVMVGTYSNNEAPVTDNVASNTPFDGSDVNNVASDDRQVVSDDSSSDSDSESDSDSDNDENMEETTPPMVIGSELNNDSNESNDGIKVVELESGGDNKQINLNSGSLEEISLNTTTTDDNDDDDNNDDDEDEDDDDDDDDDDDSDDETEATELSTDDIANVAELLNVKKVATEVTAELDFKKLNVGKLRELVVTRSLADKAGAKKMKKKQLVELLS